MSECVVGGGTHDQKECCLLPKGMDDAGEGLRMTHCVDHTVRVCHVCGTVCESDRSE